MPEIKISKMNHPHLTHNKERLYRIAGILLTTSILYLYHSISKKYWQIFEYYVPNHLLRQTLMIDIAAVLAVFLSLSFYFSLYYFQIPYFEQFKSNSSLWPWQENKEAFKKQLKKGFKLYLFNFVVVNSLVGLLLEKVLKTQTTYETFPSFHRFLHMNFIYKYIHKVHHQFYNTITIACMYAHPIEFVFGNVLPAYGGCFILGSRIHIVTFSAYVFWNLMETHETHSGYHFPLSIFNITPYSSSLKSRLKLSQFSPSEK